jgi:hypothetical protein
MSKSPRAEGMGVLEYRSIGVLGLNASLHYSTTPVLQSVMSYEP